MPCRYVGASGRDDRVWPSELRQAQRQSSLAEQLRAQPTLPPGPTKPIQRKPPPSGGPARRPGSPAPEAVQGASAMMHQQREKKSVRQGRRPTLEDLAAMNAAAALAELSQVDAAMVALAGSGVWGEDDWRQVPFVME